MPERWEEELAKVDRLAPSESLRDRVGHATARDVHDRSSRRALTIAVVVTISLATGIFAWRALSPLGSSETPEPLATSDLPDVVEVTCSASGTQVSTPTVVSARGIHFDVSNPGRLDEIIIAGTSGEGASTAADIDLSSGLEHTFTALSPGNYVVGCFSDSDTPRGLHETIVNAPGMQPIEILDPDHLYVSPVLGCAGAGTDETHGFVIVRDGLTDEEAIRSGLGGLKTEDIVEPSGYVALWQGEEHVGTFRVVRDGQVIGDLRLLGEFNFGGEPALSGYLKACQESGLRFDDPAP
jgi:hypothetical protein